MLDTETGSTDIDKAGICQIGAVVLTQDGSIAPVYSTYCRPSLPMEQGAIEVHGITPDKYQWAPNESRALQVLSTYIRALQSTYTVYLGGHNVDRYDLPLMAQRHPEGVFNKLPTVDTLRLFRRRYPQMDHKLGLLYTEVFETEAIDAHDATADCFMCAKLLWEYCEINETTFAEVAQYLSKPEPYDFMPFGKYKGMALGTDVPRSYLNWMVTNFHDPDPDLARTLQFYLEEHQNV
jgi:DNA polymerase III epsilon subunit-like protein